jgi:hypothetical protein
MQTSAKVLISIVITLSILAGAQASYVIDGNLNDWGVTPFSDWVPSGTADYTEANGDNTYNAQGYVDSLYDFEAMYFDDDDDNIYIAVVCSYPLGEGSWGGDLGLDLNGDAAISAHGVVTGLEYAVRVSSDNIADVVQNPVWTNTSLYKWPDGWQGSPYQVKSGTVIGTAEVALAVKGYPGESGTRILEVAIPKTLLTELIVGDIVTTHISMWCGNDSINLEGVVDVPEPATIFLLVSGFAFFASTNRRKM